MSVVGYNVDPESGDPCVGIEVAHPEYVKYHGGKPCAVVYIDGQLPSSWGSISDEQKSWHLSPVIGDPRSYKTCKRCAAAYERATQKQTA